MIERLIYKAIETGLEHFRNEPALVDALFDDLMQLPSDDVSEIKSVLDKKKIEIVHGYARVETKVPAIAIVLGGESESNHFLDDIVGQGTLGENQDKKLSYGAMWTHRFDISIYTDNPDESIYLYQIVKSCILAYRFAFIKAGLHTVDISGTDVHPAERYLPSHLFVRQLTISCKREFNRVLDDQIARRFAVDGLFFDNPVIQNPDEVGGVSTSITPMGET